MDAFTDPEIRRITVVASSQVGKTELMLNCVGAAIDNDPGPMLYIMPTLDTSQDFSKRRFAPMVRDTRSLAEKVSDPKSRDESNTILKKKFPGGMLTITGSNSPAALASAPIRYIFGDERDRWALSAGTEGDPWSLAVARTSTFFNAKLVDVSTPTVKGASAIEASYDLGTRERYCHECPSCGAYHEITFEDIRFEHEETTEDGKKDCVVTSAEWACPTCGCIASEYTMKRQPAKWVAANPDARKNGHRSFWITAFVSPWMAWDRIVLRFLQDKGDPERLQVFYNTVLGRLWEDRETLEDEDGMMGRREEYGAELPDGVLVLTCGVDTQDDRLEYEVMGHGMHGETWGVRYGVIMGKPDTEDVWMRLDDVIGRVYRFADGRGLRVSMTCVDSGGHYTQEVYRACRVRQPARVFPVKGMGGDGTPFTVPPKQVKINIAGRYLGTVWLYGVGVDAGKAKIMSSLKVQEPGVKYCHFPSNEGRGYTEQYFNGLLSEKLVRKRTNGRDRWMWEKLAGHIRNEPLDCRNYALAAFDILNPDMEAEHKRLISPVVKKPASQSKKRKRRERMDEW